LLVISSQNESGFYFWSPRSLDRDAKQRDVCLIAQAKILNGAGSGSDPRAHRNALPVRRGGRYRSRRCTAAGPNVVWFDLGRNRFSNATCDTSYVIWHMAYDI